MIDIEAISRRCREVGATLVLDVFQSAGIVPLNVKEWDVPIAVGGVLKWLCGGPGGSFLYVDPALRPKLEPSFTGWMAHANPFGFEPPPMRFRDDALRFALGTPDSSAVRGARGRQDRQRGGSVSVQIPNPREVALELNAEDIVCDYRPASGVRFSPHFYTTDEELDTAFAVVDEILKTGRWKRQQARQTIVT